MLSLICTTLVGFLGFTDEAARLETPVTVVFVAHAHLIPRHCGRTVANGVKACTEFNGQKLATSCVAHHPGWVMHLQARYTARVYVTQSRLIHHELFHVNDVKRAMEKHLGELRRRMFESEHDCLDAADAAQAGFIGHMKSVIAASERRRQ